MARYREFRKIYSDMVRSMCIRESYYTRGGVDAYTHLLVNFATLRKKSRWMTWKRSRKISWNTQMLIASVDSMAVQKRSCFRVHCGS